MNKLIGNSILTLLLIVIGFISSCSSPKALEYRNFNNFNVEKAGFSSSSISMDLVYFNPNSFSIQLKNADLDIYINDNFVGHTSQEYQITIPRNEEFALPVKIDVDMQHLFKNAFSTLFQKEVLIKLKGSIKIGKRNLFIKFPVNYEAKENFSIFN